MSGGRRFFAAPFLLELTAAVLVFSLAVCVNLSLFAAARQKSEDASVLSAAALTASTAADYLRAGDEAGFVSAFNAADTGGGYIASGVLCEGEKAGRGYTLSVVKTQNGTLTAYSITLTDEDGKTLVSLTAARVFGEVSE